MREWPKSGVWLGGLGDALAKRLLLIAGIVIVSRVLLLIICIALAIVIPFVSVRSFFLRVALLLILILSRIYNRISRYIRQNFGRMRRFL
ncbi:MAG: hypothetical protein ACRDHZ_23955 [Ktedonobacteraceae bacterium]